MPVFDRAVATCAGCGCTDFRACVGNCSWLAVNHDDGTGVCSNCPKSLAAWRAQQAEGKVARNVEGQGRLDGLVPVGPTDI